MSAVTGVFLKMGTLKKWGKFPKFQELSSSDFITTGVGRVESKVTFPVLGQYATDSNFQAANGVHFISHRWQALSHPDPNGEQLAQLKQGLPDDALIWYDYSCLPQEPRTPSE